MTEEMNTGRQTAYTLGRVDAGKEVGVCVLCENTILPHSFLILTCPRGVVNFLCERCITITATMLVDAQSKGASND